MSPSELETRRAELIAVLHEAAAARRGPTPAVEASVRAFGRAMREDGVQIGRTLVDAKDLVRAHTGYDEPLFTPKVIGWLIAGYFAGTTPREK